MRHDKRPARLLLALLLTSAAGARADTPLLTGADISALPDIEKSGGVFRDNGQPADEIAILRAHGCQLFRVRLFVNPDTSFDHTGATQDLAAVRALGKRIKAAGGQFLLDLHYSDTWADPLHQTTPAAWAALPIDALQAKVADYTRDVIRDLQQSGCAPDLVQVGNEITVGVLWPAGKVGDASQWAQFVRLIAAGAKAVRDAEQPGHRIRIVLHISGGGKGNLPIWFFDHFMAAGGQAIDFDVIALSFYPGWKDSLADLKSNMTALAKTYGKDILVAETAYPWQADPRPVTSAAMAWRQTPAGQVLFLNDLQAALEAVPNHHGLGWVWWYSDSIPTTGPVWHDGNEALFDHAGNALPALKAFAGGR